MGAPVLYTDTSAVRAAVGIKDTEVPDSMITDQQMERQLKTALYGWLPTYEALYDAGNAGTATADEKYIKDLLISYCLFYCCVRVIEMSLALRQSVGDGKSQVARFVTDMKALRDMYKDRLNEVQALIDDLVTPSEGGVSYFGKATPDYDPVTGI
jgi:hypothetical protein